MAYAKGAKMLQLKKQIAEKSLSGVYLLFGEERYLINLYVERIRHALLTEDEEFMNYSYVENPGEEGKVIEMMETLPFMAEHRLVVIKDCGFFAPGEDYSALLEALDRLDPSTVVLFDEKTVDKRSALYKKVSKVGRAVEFATQSPDTLSKWISVEVKDKGLGISATTAGFLVHYCGTDMTLLSNEIQKLVSLCTGSSRQEITTDDIRAVCTSNGMESIFKLTDAMSEGKPGSALTIYNELISGGEKPNGIFYMICRQFRLLLRTKILVREGSSAYDIQQGLGVQDYVAKKLMAQSSRFSEDALREALTDLLRLDANSKIGNVDISDACMSILLRYSKKQ